MRESGGVSHWGRQARSTIANVVAANPDKSEAELLELVDAAYPFGERKYWPYKEWLKARRTFIERKATEAKDITPIGRRCDACGSKPGSACVAMSGELLSTFHTARELGPSGPLFGEP